MIFENPLVSIIVPIYNSEPYLADCLASIASQTYKNIEVILVNDGSTDNSSDIAKLFCETDSRFQLISQTNSGVAAAREVGLRLAQGEFVIHTDSDDLMTERAIELLYKSIVENDSNIAIGAYIRQNKTAEEVVEHSSADRDSFIRKTLTGEYRAVLWNKLIKAELCKDISFAKNINYMEDVLFLAKVLKKDSVKISIINDITYFYRMVDTSYTNNISQASILSSIKVTDEICNIFKDEFSNKFIAHIRNKNKIRVLLNSNETQRHVSPESIKHLFNDRNIPLKHKIVIVSDLLYLNKPIKFCKKIKSKII